MKYQLFSTRQPKKQSLNNLIIPKPYSHHDQTRKYNQAFQEVLNVYVNNQQLQNQLSIYDWRCKTQFPILKISQFKVLQRKVKTTVLQIRKQKHCLKLKNCNQLPLFKVLYLLKQSLIGFQRLYNKFGPFVVTPNMIAINSSHKCKVWLNQNYAINAFIPIKLSQSIFLRGIFSLFQQKSNHMRNNNQFYQLLYSCRTFSQALNLIQIFTKQNKIVILSSCKLTAKQMIKEGTKQDFNITSSTSINKKLDFTPFSGLRISLNTTSDNPFKKMSKPNTGLQEGTGNSYLSILIRKTKTEDTAAGGRSFLDSTSNNEDPWGKGHNSDFNKKENKETIYRSQLPIVVRSPQRSNFFVRKHNSHTVDIKQFQKLAFNTQKTTKHIKADFKSLTKTQIKNYGNINDEEDQQKTRYNIENTFEKNQWNKTINTLWQDQSQVNHSIVITQQKVKAKKTPIKLQLLEKISKTVYQSFIKVQNSASSETQPPKSQA